MNKRWDERGRKSLLALVEENSGRVLTDAERKVLVTGADEHDLVYSGLEDTMIAACGETRATALENNTDFRNAAFINAIRKISTAYQGSGVMFMNA